MTNKKNKNQLTRICEDGGQSGKGNVILIVLSKRNRVEINLTRQNIINRGHIIFKITHTL